MIGLEEIDSIQQGHHVVPLREVKLLLCLIPVDDDAQKVTSRL